MSRGRHRLLQTRIYDWLSGGKEATAIQIIDWYKTAFKGGYTTDGKKPYVRAKVGAGNLPNASTLGNIMRRSILFECVSNDKDTNKHRVWAARPIEEVVNKAILAKSPLTKYPSFLREAIEKELGEQ
jgi:hypothetical protein